MRNWINRKHVENDYGSDDNKQHGNTGVNQNEDSGDGDDIYSSKNTVISGMPSVKCKQNVVKTKNWKRKTAKKEKKSLFVNKYICFKEKANAEYKFKVYFMW